MAKPNVLMEITELKEYNPMEKGQVDVLKKRKEIKF